MIFLIFSIFFLIIIISLYLSQLKYLESEDEIAKTNRQKQVVKNVDGRVNVKTSLYN